MKRIGYRDKVIYKGGIYHITQRAPGKEMLFLEEDDYITFHYLIKKCTKDFKLDTFSFCPMPNHLHLLLRINEANLSEAMKSLFTSYGVRFNKKYERKGHVFCGVYRASMCLDDAHLIGASLYIHLNPQKAGIVRDACDYQWSSVGAYINPQDKIERTFLNNDFILKIIDEDLNKAAFLYRKMLKDSNNVEYENIIENPRAIINFTKSIYDKMTEHLEDRKIRNEFIISEREIDEKIKGLTNGNKKHAGVPADKKAVIYLIKQLKSRGFTIKEIAKTLNIAYPIIYRRQKSR